MYVDATLVLARYVPFWILKWVAYEAATVLEGTKHWHSHDNFIKRVYLVYLCMFVVILVMKAVTVRCGVRIGQAVRIKYTQIKHKILQARNGQFSGQRYIARSMEWNSSTDIGNSMWWDAISSPGKEKRRGRESGPTLSHTKRVHSTLPR
jgi:hypothetical protein